MPVECNALNSDFVVPSFYLATKFRKFLMALNAAQTDTSSGKAGGDRAANRKVVVVRDPEMNLFLAHKNFATEKAFIRRKEVKLLESKGLSTDPSFDDFLENLDGYVECSPMLRSAISPLPRDLSENLDEFDSVLDFTSWESVAAYFKQEHGLDIPPPEFLHGLVPPPLLPIATIRKAKAKSAPHYETLEQYLGESAYVLSRGDNDLVKKGEPMPILRPRPSAEVRDDIVVACMLKEDEVVVRRFIEYYLMLGVGQIKLFFDDPEDKCIAIAKGYDRVRAIACDDSFWKGNRKNAVEGRQKHCYTHAYREQEKGWLVVCDTDEFVVPPKTLAALLDSCPPDQRVCRFWPGEAVWDMDMDSSKPFSASHTRSILPPDIWNALKSKKRPEVRRMFRHGMLSHRSGKYAVRVDSGATEVGLHRADYEDGYNSVRLPHDLPRGVLVHFDAICFEQWYKKISNRLRKGHGFFGFDAARKSQLAGMKDHTKEEMRSVFKELYHIDAEEIELLARVGSISKLEIFD